MLFCEKTHIVTRTKYKNIDANFMNKITLPVPLYQLLGLVVRNVNRAIHQIVIPQSTFYLLRVPYPWCHCFLCLFGAVAKTTIHRIVQTTHIH